MADKTTIILDILGLIGLSGGGLVILFSSRSKENNKASSELIANLTKLRETDKEDFNKRIKALEDQRVDDIKAIADLQGQVKVYKELPLRELAEGIKQVASSNEKILNELQKTAVFAAEDRESTMQGTAEVALEVKKRK